MEESELSYILFTVGCQSIKMLPSHSLKSNAVKKLYGYIRKCYLTLIQMTVKQLTSLPQDEKGRP